jgi:acyl-CoA synthetase (AMP-forming)/AMP-acid ligase II
MMESLPKNLLASFKDVPDRVAIRLVGEQGDQVVSFKELIQGSYQYALSLGEEGIGQGEVVIIILQHGVDLIHAFFGSILYGAIPSIMPFLTEKLSPQKYRQSLAALIEITKPAAIISYPEFIPEVEDAIPKGNSVRVIINSSKILTQRDVDITNLPGMNSSPEDVVLLQHSSGTTGLQKGVALSHRAVINQVQCYAEAINMTLDDVVVSWLPLYHDMGLIAGFIMPILLRTTLVLMSPFEWIRAPYKLMTAISKYRGTLVWLPNFAYNFCAQKIRERDLEGVDLSSWRAVINCSEPMRWHSHQMFLERFRPYGFDAQALATCYAMAENVFAVTQGGIGDPVNVDEIDLRAMQEERRAVAPKGQGPSFKMLSAGPPINNTRVRVVDEKRVDLPERHIGEIVLQSECMLTGYFNRKDLTERAFHDGWYLTGDLGYLADGELYVTGRKKEMIIVGGKNIYPQDLEEVAADVEGVHPGRVVAFGLFNEDAGTEDVVVVAETDIVEPEERRRIATEIRKRVNQGSDIALRYVEVVDRMWLVKTSSGKVARNANREKYVEQFRSG